jgi:hypothetical protein
LQVCPIYPFLPCWNIPEVCLFVPVKYTEKSAFFPDPKIAHKLGWEGRFCQVKDV